MSRTRGASLDTQFARKTTVKIIPRTLSLSLSAILIRCCHRVILSQPATYRRSIGCSLCLRHRAASSRDNFACAPLSAYSGQIGMQLFWDCRGEWPGSRAHTLQQPLRVFAKARIKYRRRSVAEHRNNTADCLATGRFSRMQREKFACIRHRGLGRVRSVSFRIRKAFQSNFWSGSSGRSIGFAGFLCNERSLPLEVFAARLWIFEKWKVI